MKNVVKMFTPYQNIIKEVIDVFYSSIVYEINGFLKGKLIFFLMIKLYNSDLTSIIKTNSKIFFSVIIIINLILSFLFLLKI